MSMELNRRELKSRARERIRETQPPFWLVTLVFLLLTTGVSTVTSLTDTAYISLSPGPGDTMPLFLSLLITLLATVLSFGYQLWALKVYRRQDPGYSTLIDGFSMAGRIILMKVYIWLCEMAWIILLTIPAAILSVQALYLGLSPFFCTLILYLCMWLGTLFISYRYILAPFLLMDRPGAGPFAAVRESVALMRGWKWQFFKLDLSFLIWHFLNWILSWGVILIVDFPAFLALIQMENLDPLTLALGLQLSGLATLLSTLIQVPISLWVTPYSTVSYAGFYQTRVQQPFPPVWGSYQGPYDGPYNGPDL